MVKKAAFSLMFDVIVWDETYYALREMLRRYRLRAGLAIDPTALAPGLPITDFVREMRDEGHEILIHTPHMGPFFLADCEHTDEEIRKYFLYYRDCAAALGYDCKGLVIAGGLDSKDQVREIARMYYTYCQSVKNCTQYARDPSIVPYNMPGTDPIRTMRTNMEENNVCPSDVLHAMERCICDGGRMVLYAHNYITGKNWHVTEETLDTVLSFLRAHIDSREIIFDIPEKVVTEQFG